LERGLFEEFKIRRGHFLSPYRLISAAIEEDMFFVTYIYFVAVSLKPLDAYRLWKEAPDAKENRVIVAYQLEGTDADGNLLDGAERLAQLLAKDEFDGQPHVLPKPHGDRPIIAGWHPSSRLRLYAAGRHMYGDRFGELVQVSG